MTGNEVLRMLVVDALPAVAVELRNGLLTLGEDALAASVESLRLLDRCRCGDSFCGTFYTAPPPQGAYGPTHRNIELDSDHGMIILDVVDERIACVEILYWDEVRDRLAELLPRRIW